MAVNDGDEDLLLEVRVIIDRIHKATNDQKGIRLSAYELQLLRLTIFAEDSVISK